MTASKTEKEPIVVSDIDSVPGEVGNVEVMESNVQAHLGSDQHLVEHAKGGLKVGRASHPLGLVERVQGAEGGHQHQGACDT